MMPKNVSLRAYRGDVPISPNTIPSVKKAKNRLGDLLRLFIQNPLFVNVQFLDSHDITEKETLVKYD